MKTALRTLFTALGLVVLLALPGYAKEPAKASAKAPDKASDTGRTVRQYTIQQFLANTAYGGSSFSPDNKKILVGSNQTGVFNAFAFPVDGGKPVQLTDSKVSAVQAIGYFPQDERFLYTSDQGGNEKTHLYVQSPDGQVKDLTPGENLKADFGGWTPDGKGFFYISNERDPSLFDVYEMSFDGYEKKLLYTNEGGYLPGAVSPDRRYVTLFKTQTSTDSDIYLHDRTTGKTTLLTPDDPAPANTEVSNNPADFSPDGKSFYYTTDKGSEFSYLVRYDLASGQRTEVLKTSWDVAGADFSRDAKWFTVFINNDGRNELRVFKADGMTPVELPTLPGADVTNVGFSYDGNLISFYAEAGGPRDLYLRDVRTGEVRQLTHALNPAIDAKDLVEPEVVRFKSYDGVEVPGILYKPHQASPSSPVPALVWVHGGPGGQSRVGYSGFIQFLVNHGYAVYAINNRGSSGYGKTFFAMDDRKHGDADLGDCVASKKMLTGTGWVDPDRIGIVGGSYGGYMVLAALAFRPQEFAVGVDLYGVSNWLRTLSSIPDWWGPTRDSLYKELGDPKVDEAYLRKISPSSTPTRSRSR